MHPTSGDHLPIRNAHENDHESIDTSPAGAPRQAHEGPELARTALHAALTHQEDT